MPNVSVTSSYLFELMGVKPMETDKFRELLLRFGLELDGAEEEDGKLKFKIEVPANRADLLSVESIAVNLKCFLDGNTPVYNLEGAKTQMIIDPSVKGIRPFIICAVLRGVDFSNQEAYDSFIDFQDKLHQNLCRRRTLASIGTHDLNKVKGPFKYSCEKPDNIVFVPLKSQMDDSEDEINGSQMYERMMNQKKSHLKKYLHLLDVSDRWPVVRDADGKVMSLPPIINSEYSKLTSDTRDVFIECTAVDYTRAVVAVISLCAGFSIYCSKKFTIELVEIVEGEKKSLSPKFEYIDFDVDLSYINMISGVNHKEEDIISLLRKMQLKAVKTGEGKLKVTVPPTRADVLHPCDIAEDVCIAYGYDKINQIERARLPGGKPITLSEYTERLSREFSSCLYTQILTFSLCRRAECFDMLCLPDDGSVVVLKNAKEAQCEVIRNQLLAGLLKVTHNILDQKVKNSLPLRLFECSDVVLPDPSTETNTRNERRLAASIAATKSSFQDIHGLLDRFFTINRVKSDGYSLISEDSPTCIPGQRAKIVYNGSTLGWIGVIHPKVMLNFDLTTPVAAFEIIIDPFLKK